MFLAISTHSKVQTPSLQKMHLPLKQGQFSRLLAMYYWKHVKVFVRTKQNLYYSSHFDRQCSFFLLEENHSARVDNQCDTFPYKQKSWAHQSDYLCNVISQRCIQNFKTFSHRIYKNDKFLRDKKLSRERAKM